MSPEIRIGDAEREQAQAELGEHYAAGRLDHDEYSQRLDQVWAARTRSELAPIFRDLPYPGGRAASAASASRPPSRQGRRASARVPLPLLVLLVALGVVAVVTHLPILLVGLGVWFFFLRGGAHCRYRT